MGLAGGGRKMVGVESICRGRLRKRTARRAAVQQSGAAGRSQIVPSASSAGTLAQCGWRAGGRSCFFARRCLVVAAVYRRMARWKARAAAVEEEKRKKQRPVTSNSSAAEVVLQRARSATHKTTVW